MTENEQNIYIPEESNIAETRHNENVYTTMLHAALDSIGKPYERRDNLLELDRPAIISQQQYNGDTKELDIARGVIWNAIAQTHTEASQWENAAYAIRQAKILLLPTNNTLYNNALALQDAYLQFAQGQIPPVTLLHANRLIPEGFFLQKTAENIFKQKRNIPDSAHNSNQVAYRKRHGEEIPYHLFFSTDEDKLLDKSGYISVIDFHRRRFTYENKRMQRNMDHQAVPQILLLATLYENAGLVEKTYQSYSILLQLAQLQKNTELIKRVNKQMDVFGFNTIPIPTAEIPAVGKYYRN